jgi:alkylation response protein AidB-like acyl-CoA dehydrogenase
LIRKAERSTFMFDHGPAELRSRLRELMGELLPPGWLGPFTNNPEDLALSVQFCQSLAAEGLLVPEWPVRFGGQDADLASGVVVREEMWANCEPRGPQYYGPNWVGPSIAHYGTEEQRKQHLPEIAAGRAIWCQGFSEPEAGSDLHSIRTQAVRDGDQFVITGQKIWTSWALWARWCYLLAQVVDPDGGPSGITVFLVPMDRDGVSVRGIDGLPGPHHLNELFLDDVRVTRADILGEIGDGWRVIKDALANERVGIARYARSDRALSLAGPLLNEQDGALSPLRARFLEARVHNRIARLLCRNALSLQRDGGSDDYAVSAARLATTRGDQEVADLVAEIVGDRFFEDRYTDDAPAGGFFEFLWRYSRAATIASGTTEILQILLSRRLFKGDSETVASEGAELADAVEAVMRRHDGIEAVRTARLDPGTRLGLHGELGDLLAGLDPREDDVSSLIAAEACRRAGRFLAPVPIEALLMARADGRPLTLAPSSGRIEHGDLAESWLLAGPDRSVTEGRYQGPLLGTRLGSFVTAAAPKTGMTEPALTDAEYALLLALPAWYILGALERGLEMTVEYAQQRVQFGQPISANQGVAFPLADASAAIQGLHKLAEHALWRIHANPRQAVADALALRWASLEAARRVLAVCQQAHGAIGLCDEHDFSLVVTGLQPRLRLPMDLAATLGALASAVAEHGFESIYTPTTADE